MDWTDVTMELSAAGREDMAEWIWKEREAGAVLFDGFAVLQALDEKAKARTSAENVSDVLDAVVRLMRSNACGEPGLTAAGDD